MKTKEAKSLAKKKIVRKRVRKKPIIKKVAEPEVKKVEDLDNVEKVQLLLIVLIIAGMFYFGT